MFFKKLEIFGFKSFAEKTELDFEAGVTAIVGPNGCGKSNIADAIKWVLGEQSVRSMRGASMEDVIFHGADSLSPVGFAEVSLTISNQDNLLPLDYEEVTISRRIFRSGESEYLINKIPVRLKDILELLMGTGLGMHSYSLMEQGKVDQVLSSRPEDRRMIFEEASGITKYKSKKEEALRKLERTGENLQRLGDIIIEVKRQIKSIERQVNKAQRYKLEFDKLKEYELRVSKNQYQNLKIKKKDLEDKNQHLQSQEASLSSKMDSCAQTLEAAKQDLTCVNENFSRIQGKSYEVSAAIKTAENKITLDQERIEELNRRSTDIEQQIQGFEEKIIAIGEQIEKMQKQIEATEQHKHAQALLIEEKEKNVVNILAAVKEAQKEVSEAKMQEVEVIAQQARVKNEITKLEANLANLNARLRRLNVESERTQEELGNVETRHELCLEEFTSLNGQLKQLTKETWDLKSSLEIKSQRKQKLRLKLDELSRQTAALQSKLNFLEEITKKYEGFSSGVKTILSAIDERRLEVEGFCGVLANLIEVLPEYQPAIEMALGENAQAIVVENIQAACTGIQYLKTENTGRANFICLDNLSSRQTSSARPPHTFLGAACDFVKIEPKYQKVLESLLSNTFIVREFEDVSQIRKDLDPDVRLVAVNGEVLTKASIIAGSVPENVDSSLLGRREKIAQTAEELEKIKTEKTELENLQSARDSEIREIEEQIRQKEPCLHELKINLANQESAKANIESEKKRFQDEISVLGLEIDETAEQIQQLEGEKENLSRDLKGCEETQTKLQNSIQNCQDIIAQKNQERQNTLVEVAQIKTEISALEKRGEDAQANLQMVLESEAEQRQVRQSREKEAEDTGVKIGQLSQEITELKLQGKQLSQNKLSVEEELSQTLQERQRLSAAIHDLEERSRENQKELNGAREKRSELQIKLTEINYQQDSLHERMKQSYQVDLRAALDEVLETLPLDETIFDEINRLKARLEGMGPVNLVAIEENDQLQQRHDFLITQQQDLLNAQESLRKAIAQINHTARNMFADTFQKVQVSFKEYFRILFGGGDARLILLEENSVLESGIEIVVRPPGKKLQNISLLSGGEKAMTAIALLFAIFKVKPSPFCILDEVDAPLDEANVDRFTNLLAEFIKTSQFIIVTHNKKTINMADIMYGITMEKSGVSKIVSVRFTEEKKPSAREVAQIEG